MYVNVGLQLNEVIVGNIYHKRNYLRSRCHFRGRRSYFRRRRNYYRRSPRIGDPDYFAYQQQKQQKEIRNAQHRKMIRVMGI